jgi:hypothetical protein
VFLISSSIVLRQVLFRLPLFLYPENSILMRFSLLVLLLYIMCVQPNSIFFFLSKFLLVSGWLFSIVLHLQSYRSILCSLFVLSFYL